MPITEFHDASPSSQSSNSGSIFSILSRRRDQSTQRRTALPRRRRRSSSATWPTGGVQGDRVQQHGQPQPAADRPPRRRLLRAERQSPRRLQRHPRRSRADRQWKKQLEIVLCALDKQRSIGEGQFRRAKKALIDLAIGMLEDKQSNATFAQRNRSFGRQQRSLGHFRSLSWSVSRSCRVHDEFRAPVRDVGAGAAIPCQDRGLQAQFNVPKQFLWAGSILSLHERIVEESKRRDRRNVCGLLREIEEIEKCTRHLNELGIRLSSR
ncbi:hypothetical protein SASPL_131312 [Salvia splendens]|uniref:Uncharacterized protein n=1 Tax=Salvia splendens TaxID=180675 RepID=A0A8X8X8I5_SALSN|nr:hypothetical protein SASPL_131312 [Salvia splendens]